MTEPAPDFRIVYRGMTEQTARRLERENVITKEEPTDTTLHFWNACDPLDTRRDAFLHIMAIRLPNHAQGHYDREHDTVILDGGLILKCVGRAEFTGIPTPDGQKRNIRMYAMEIRL